MIEWTSPMAIVIEPRPDLAHALADVLQEHGFHVLTAATHVGAAALADGHCPLLVVACVPAPGDCLDLAYLAMCRHICGDIATVLLVSDPTESCDGSPEGAVTLMKPFTRSELLAAIDRALMQSLSKSDASAASEAGASG